jgi:two-component system, cell cycle sensor histidine kinase and response regulator CckA
LSQQESKYKPAGPEPTSGSPRAVDLTGAESPATAVSPSPNSVQPSDRDHEINKELRRLKRALRALSACNQALAQARSEQELLQQITDVIVRMGAYRFCWIGYAEQDEEKMVRPMAYAGHEDGYLSVVKMRWSDADTGRGPSGIAVRENRICAVTDISKDPSFVPWREAALARGYAAAIGLPLCVEGKPFGVLSIYSDQPGSFELSEVELVKEISSSLAFGIAAVRSQEESRRATAARREAEARYRQLVEEVPAISYVAVAGALEPFIYLSPQVTTILGYHPEDCLGDSHFWWNHLNPEDHAIAQTEDTWEEGRPIHIEYRMRRSDGIEVWIRDEAMIFREADTGKRMIRGLMIDITERKLAEEALRRSEENYRLFVAQSSEVIFRTEHIPPIPIDLPADKQAQMGMENGYIAVCNDAMARLYGFDAAQDLVGKRLADFVKGSPVVEAFLLAFIHSGYRLTEWESQGRYSGGRVRTVRTSMIGIVEKGHILRTWCIQRDVTERVHLEEQLRNAQRLEAIGRLAGGVAHDFNNILSIIMGHSELLLGTIGGNERALNGLAQIRRAADRAASLTRQLLAFSRKQVLQPKILDLNEAITDVQKMLVRVIGEDIELVAALLPSLASVKADPGQIEQVLMNLALNARDAMPQGGKLVMETSNIELNERQGRDLDLPAGRYVGLKVSDTGHGMDSETLAHIFEPFFTTKPMGKGTGLGLATVYGIVKQSGGSIQVESETGKGTIFSIYLPIEESSNRSQQERSTAAKIAGGTETILVVEDEPDLRDLMRIFLESYGYRVLEASSAEKAIQKADGCTEPIHLLLTDVIMPGMSGRQLAEKIMSRHPRTKIIYMTGYTDDMVMQHKVLEPGVQLLQKPFTKVELATKVRATLDGKTARTRG